MTAPMRGVPGGLLRSACLVGLTIGAACGSTDRAYRGRSADSWSEQLEAATPADRIAAADALYHIAPQSSGVVDALLRAMRDTNGQVQSAVAVALATTGSRSIPGLEDALRDDHANVRALAVRLLANQGAGAFGSRSAIAERLSDPDYTVQREAALALEHMGSQARESTPALVTCAATGTPEVRAACLGALVAVAPESPDLHRIADMSLGDPAAVVRRTAVGVVGAIDSVVGSHARWTRLGHDPDPSVRLVVFQALAKRSAMAGSAPELRMELRKGLVDADSSVRTLVRDALDPRPAAPNPHALPR